MIFECFYKTVYKYQWSFKEDTLCLMSFTFLIFKYLLLNIEFFLCRIKGLYIVGGFFFLALMEIYM